MKSLLLCAALLSPCAALADGYGFMTPTGNIYCNGAVEVSEISCVIVERSGPLPMAKPASCNATWGHRFQMTADGPASMTCGATPATANYTDIATYGVTATFGDITCVSETTGLTCRNKSGHGFTLSRRQQTLF